ncbi:YheC/YheD family protein [Bacillus salitolerans]|uniref:YheC/YheD family protein n=1 Tax=Bacillus salitolerans TaxID=1437434 RepID=A0ABW4LN93_9BACI
MILIGMLHYRKSPEDERKAFACAAVAKMEGVEFIYFSYGGVDFAQKKIKGWDYEDGKWRQREVRFPDVIINISGPRTERQVELHRQLKESIPFTSFSVGNKMKVYKMVKKGKVFSDYLIHSEELKNEALLFSSLNQYKKIVIKPFSGNKGKNVLFLEKIDFNHFQLVDQEKKRMLSRVDLRELIRRLKRENRFLIQPYIECKTKAGLTYDFRLHVQKNGKGEWEVTLIYPRISGNQKLVSNVSSGGYRGELDMFLQDEFGDNYFDMKRTLEYFATSFSSHLDEQYQCSFDELGIDIGVDRNQKLWIFEVNWRPGSKHREFEVAKRLIPYAIYLVNGCEG